MNPPERPTMVKCAGCGKQYQLQKGQKDFTCATPGCGRKEFIVE